MTCLMYAHVQNIGKPGSFEEELNKMLAANELPTVKVPDTPNSKELITFPTIQDNMIPSPQSGITRNTIQEQRQGQEPPQNIPGIAEQESEEETEEEITTDESGEEVEVEEDSKEEQQTNTNNISTPTNISPEPPTAGNTTHCTPKTNSPDTSSPSNLNSPIPPDSLSPLKTRRQTKHRKRSHLK